MKWIIVTALALAFVAGCATPPKEHSIEKSRTYSKSKDEVWSNLMQFFSDNSIQIKTLERDSGVVYAEVVAVKPGLSLDCGSPGIWNVRSTSATINVFIREAASGEVTATVNTVGVKHRQFDVSYQTVQCVSTGHIERRILDAL